jgi:sialate O-acetylesterase
MKSLRFSALAGLSLLAFSTQAAVKLPRIFGNDMVLQQGQPVPVWGWADPGEKITVEFAGQKKETAAKADGMWQLKLDALKASAEPAVFKVTASNAIELNNVVVGEVWFCSGQSNMEWVMHGVDNAAQEIAHAKYPLIRHFKAPKNFKPAPENDISANWVITTPESVGGQSAVAFFFGRRLHQELKVPVGLINCSWGGTRIEPWTPPCGFADLPELAGIKDRVDSADPKSPLHQKVLGDYVAAMQAWIADANAKTVAGQPLAAAPAFPQNLIFPMEQGRHQEPTVLFNGMVAGLVPFAIKGAIWYQGCSNNGEGMLYLEKTKALVNGWRKVWGQGDFPYYLVQLAPYNYGPTRATALPGIWEAQAAVPSALPNTGCTVINDIGNVKNIHPTNKQDVGLRMANQALNRTYGRKETAWAGPVCKSFAIEGAKLRVAFDDADGLKTRDGKAPAWFELCGEDGLFLKADAVIEGATVVLSAPTVTAPMAMRFAWDQTAEPNLVNGLGLPAGAFRCGNKPQLGGALSLPELRGFRKVYEIDLPANAHFAAAAPKYETDASASAGAFTQVAYVLQLQEAAGSIRYVFASMDAFTQEAKKLGIPYAKSGIRHQTKVNNLTVRSNVDSIPKLDNSDGGNIEFWDANYGNPNGLNLPGADSRTYDFDDQPAGDGGYGCMQLHAWKNKATLLAFNNFNGGGACDIGIGNNTAGEHSDYTFMGNGGQYSTRRLTVFVK